MKNFLIILYLIVLFIPTHAIAQITFPYDPRPATVSNHPAMDTTKLHVRYKMSYVKDVSYPDEITDNIMSLQIGTNLSKFSDYSVLVADSVGNAMAAAGATRSERYNTTTAIRSGRFATTIFKNYPEAGIITTTDRIPFNTYRYKEDTPILDWKLIPGDSTICEYACKKATTHLHGREYTVWYTPEIPISEGPWKLSGLPGLILKATDHLNHYSVECMEIIKPTWEEIIYIHSAKPFSIKKEQFFRLQKRYYENPAASVEGSGMIKSDLPASARVARPYNPIELSQ